MKYSKIIFGIVAILALAYGAYYYMSYYYGVKDYATSKADYTLTAEALKSEFVSNETSATQKYQNKAVEITGTVKELAPNTITIDGVSCKMETPQAAAKAGDNLKVKGRVVGYDSLLEEVQLDQCTVVE